MAKSPSGFRVGNVNYGRFSGVNPSRAANNNLTIKDQIKEIESLRAESDKMLKEESRNWKVNSGKAAYGPKPPSTASKIATAAKGVAGGVARGVGRLAGPAGALVGMTEPAGEGSDRPSGPLMAGNKSRGPGGGSLSAPARTDPSRSGGTSNSRGPGGPNGPNSGPSRSSNPSRGGGGPGGPSGPNSGPSRSGGARDGAGPSGPNGPNSGSSRSSNPSSGGGGPGGPSGPNSGSSRSSSPSGPSRSSGPGGPSGPNSGPSNSSSSPRGSERFAKGSLVMAKSAKKNYFSKEAVKRSRSSFKAPKGRAR